MFENGRSCNQQVLQVVQKIDVKDTETIQIDEFYAYIKTERTKFADRCFYFLDNDRSNEIDFKEFVLALWIFLTVRNNNFVRLHLVCMTQMIHSV